MWVCVFLMVYRWEGPKLNYQHLLHMFTNIGDLWGKICCVSYLRCKGDTRSINGSPLWMFNGLCFLLRVMYSWNAITDYNGTMVNPSTGVYTSMPGMMWICGVSFAERNCSWLQQFCGEQPMGTGDLLLLFPIDSPTREVDLPMGTSPKINEQTKQII